MPHRKALAKASLYYHTIRPLGLKQIAHRIKLSCLRKVESRMRGILTESARRTVSLGITGFGSPLPRDFQRMTEALAQCRDKRTYLESADLVLQNTYDFLNHRATLQGEALWRCPEASRLWRFHVHYFGYALDLAVAYAVTGRTEYYSKFAELVQDWLLQNPLGQSDAWHPYPTALRIVNWLYARVLFEHPLRQAPDLASRLEEAICLQADYLTKHLEYDVRGNHLIENARALLIASLFFSGPLSEKWYDTALKILVAEIDEQVLKDGGHFERSIHYHLLMLYRFSEMSILLQRAGRPVLPVMKQAVRRMTSFLRGVVHPDGDLALFGDGELAGPLHVQGAFDLSGAALDNEHKADASVLGVLLGGQSGTRVNAPVLHQVVSRDFPDSGYFSFRAGQDYLLIDCGEPCPAYLPGHGHCDLLSYELSVRGRRFVVDPGTFGYDAGQRRQEFRSTSVHNTVIVNGLEQSEVWGAFRMARRAKVLYAGKRVVDGDTEAFVGAYVTPYGGQSRIVHQRAVLWVGQSFWVVVDTVLGSSALAVRNQVLLAPECRVRMDGDVAEVDRDGVRLYVFGSPALRMRCEPAEYSPHFGRIDETNRLVLSGSTDASVLTTAYALVPVDIGISRVELDLQDGWLRVKEGSRELECEVPFPGADHTGS